MHYRKYIFVIIAVIPAACGEPPQEEDPCDCGIIFSGKTTLHISYKAEEGQFTLMPGSDRVLGVVSYWSPDGSDITVESTAIHALIDVDGDDVFYSTEFDRAVSSRDFVSNCRLISSGKYPPIIAGPSDPEEFGAITFDIGFTLDTCCPVEFSLVCDIREPEDRIGEYAALAFGISETAFHDSDAQAKAHGTINRKLVRYDGVRRGYAVKTSFILNGGSENAEP